MFYLKLILGLVLKNPFKTAFVIILIWLWNVQSRHSVPVTYRNDIGFSQQVIHRGDVKIILNKVSSNYDIEYDTSLAPKFLVTKDGKLPVFHDEKGWYYTTKSFDDSLVVSWIGLLVFSMLLFFSSISDDDDFNWEYETIWIEVAKGFVRSHEEDGYYHYVFGKYLIYKTPTSGYNTYPEYTIKDSLRILRTNSKSFPVWEPIEVRRDRKLGKLV